MTVINTNFAALTAQINLDHTSQMLQSSVEKLSSGLRINHAADDAAGLAISTSLTSAINGTEQGIRNAQDGISMIQTADGALGQVQSVLQRMRELAVEASNGDLSSTDRTAIQQELNQLGGNSSGDAIYSIVQNTKYNGLSLLSGNLATSTSAATPIAVAGGTTLTVSNLDISGAKANTTYSLSVCSGNNTATLTAVSSGVTVASQTITIRDMTANDAQTFSFNQMGVGFALSTNGTAYTEGQILSAVSGDSFTTAAATSAVTVQMGPDNAASDRVSVNFNAMDPSTLGLSSLDVSTATSAQSLISTIDNAINSVSTQRSQLGASQNSLQYSVQALQVGDENLTAANSQILDVDVSAETVNFTKEQILSQAGTSVLAQANALPQSVLKLLG